jgi:hypothetical protein
MACKSRDSRGGGQKIKALGLYEPVPGQPDTPTALGREVNIDLMLIFMGICGPYDVSFILEEYSLITEEEILEAERRLEKEDPDAVLLPLVRRAFFGHFRAGARPN